MQCLSRIPSRLGPVILAASALLLVSCDAPEPVPLEELSVVEQYQRDPASLARGEALYEGSCARYCHEVEGDNAAELFDCEWIHGSSDEEIHRIITDGIPDTRMVGFGDNFPQGDEDIWRLIAFLRHNQAPCQEPDIQ